MERRGLTSRRRRQALGLGASYGFLRPPSHRDADDEHFRERLRTEPEFRRQYRSTLLVQLTVVGALLVASVTLVVQAIVLVRRVAAATSSAAWVLPVGVGILSLLVLRRFLRLVSDYRSIGRD